MLRIQVSRCKFAMLAFVAIVGAMEQAESRQQSEAQQPSPATTNPIAWTPLVVPETDDPATLELFLDETKKRQPIQP
ncbi:MAG: hypothetical protein ABL921_17740, partial [Pirellula sp.]